MAQMEFYCCDCELVFESEPDGTGYDQAPCPQCNHVSMTSEFEGKATEKSRFIVIAEFYDEDSAEPLLVKLEDAGIEVQVTLPDVTEGDFFTGGVNENVCVMVDSGVADEARKIIQSMDEEE